MPNKVPEIIRFKIKNKTFQGKIKKCINLFKDPTKKPNKHKPRKEPKIQ